MPNLQIRNLSKRFGETVAVDNLDLDVEEGELITLLGPSGCGKTTTLRSIAGFVEPDAGEIYVGDEPMSRLPPERRDIGFVFQNHALWPHMTVYQNLAFGLELRGTNKQDIRRRVDETLRLVRLSGLEERTPRQLSGGQQQRVALARALVIQPSLLLLDEPLSSLDAQLREEMRFEIRELQKKLGITSVYVTHDQAEALVLSDRIAVMHQGRLMQVGTPTEIYDQPRNRFVAGFIGLTSFIEGHISELDESADRAVVKTDDDLTIQVPKHDFSIGQSVTLSIRPQHIQLSRGDGTAPSASANVLEGKVHRAAYLGDVVDYRIKINDWELRAQTPTDEALRPGEDVVIVFEPERVTVIPEGDRPTDTSRE